MIAAFYAENPTYLLRSVPRKLVAMFGTKTSILLAVILLFEIAVLATCRVRERTPQRLIVLGLMLAIGVLATRISDPCVFSHRPLGFRARILLSDWRYAAVVSGAECVDYFHRAGSGRNRSYKFRVRGSRDFRRSTLFAPARFVLILVASFLVVRMLEALVLPLTSR